MTPGGLVQTDIGVTNGKIITIGSLSNDSAQETYDAMIDVFTNDTSPTKFIQILQDKPEEAKAIQKYMLDNTNNDNTNNDN